MEKESTGRGAVGSDRGSGMGAGRRWVRGRAASEGDTQNTLAWAAELADEKSKMGH